MKKLGWVTVGFVYFLMNWGNLVSATGSGLGCPDWPLCHGTVTPALSFEVFFEWGHRLLAAAATILILVTVFKLWTARDNKYGSLKRSARTLVILLGLQILLGGLTVVLGLSPAVSTIHLLIASIVWGGLIAVAMVLQWGNPVVSAPSPKVKRLALASLGAMVIQLILGALVRHTHAGLACPKFPGCLDGFFPSLWTQEATVSFLHRWWGILMLGVLIHVAIAARKAAATVRGPGLAIGFLGVAQVGLGILTVLTGLHTHTRATHGAVGYAIWGLLCYLAVRNGALTFLWTDKKSVKRG